MESKTKMDRFNKILGYSIKMAMAIFKGKSTPNYNASEIPISKKDMDEVFHKVGREYQNRQEFMDDIDVDEDWEDLERHISPVKKVYYLKYAATLLVVLGISAFLYFFNQPQDIYLNTPTITAGSEKATLILSNGESVDLFANKNYFNENAHSEDSRLIYNPGESTEGISYNTLKVPRGGQFFVELSDGTKVWMNSESELRFPIRFSTGNSRNVTLVYGEAYFDVSHSTEHDGDSFKVLTEGQEIEVLGTQFNVQAYKDEEKIYTTLVKGSIEISNSLWDRILKPGEQATNFGMRQMINVKDVDVNYAIAWKDGFFRFDNEPLEEMMKVLSRWYNVEIIFENLEKRNYRFSGSLKRTEHISKLLNNIEQTNEVKFKINGTQIVIK